MKSDPIITEARRELADLDARRHEIESWIARYERYKAAASGAASPDHQAEDEPAPQTRGAPADRVMSAVHDILLARGDALTLSAIFDALTERGVVVGGRNPKQNLSQKLSAHPDLKSYGKRGWYFADTIPPCLQPPPRLPDDEYYYEEGPDTEVTRPCSNGAADCYSA